MPRFARRLARARAAVHGDPIAARDLAEAAVAAADTESQRVAARLVRALVLARLGLSEAEAEARACLAYFEGAGDSAGVAEALIAIGTTQVLAGRPAAADPVLLRARDLADGGGTPALRAAALGLLGLGRSDQGRLDEADAMLRESVGLALQAGALPLRMLHLGNLGQNLLRMCLAEPTSRWNEARALEAEACLVEAEAWYHAVDNRRMLGAIVDNRAQLCLVRGQLARGLHLATEAHELAVAVGDVPTQVWIALTRARLWHAQGDPDVVIETIDAALALAEAAGIAGGVAELRALRAQAAVLR